MNSAQRNFVGGWGQLPFELIPDASYPYADLASDGGLQFATLEYDKSGAPHVFTGEPIAHENLVVKTNDQREFAEESNQKNAEKINCASCAAPLEPPQNRDVKTLGCDFCGAQNDLSTAEAQVLGMNPKGEKPSFEFEIGQVATFRGINFEICGRQLNEDDEGYQALQYLLWHPDRGYFYLEADDEGEYTLTQSTLVSPNVDPFDLDEGDPIQAGSRRYTFIEDGTLTVKYVDGAFPWQVACGDQSDYADFEKGSAVYGVERGRREIEYSVGKKLSADAVYKAFGLENKGESADSTDSTDSTEKEKVGCLKQVGIFIFSIFFFNLLIVTLALGSHGYEEALKSFNPWHHFFSDYSLGAAVLMAIATVLRFFLYGTIRNFIYFIFSLILAIISPLSIVFALIVLIVLNLKCSERNTEFTPPSLMVSLFIAGIMGFVFMSETNERMQVAVDSAKRDLQAAQTKVTAQLASVQQTRINIPWIRVTVPEVHQWISDLQKQQKQLKTAQSVDYRKVVTLRDNSDYGFFSEHPIKAPLIAITISIYHAETTVKTVQQAQQQTVNFKRDLVKNLATYQDNYQKRNSADPQQLKALIERAKQDWQSRRVSVWLDKAWSDSQQKQAKSSAASSKIAIAKIDKLWTDNLALFEQAKRGEISMAVYQKLPKAWSAMQTLSTPLQAQFKDIHNLIAQLYSHWEHLLVDLEIKETRSDLSFYKNIRLVKVQLSPYDTTHSKQVSNTIDTTVRSKIGKVEYNRLEPFMGMALEQKAFGEFAVDAKKLPTPAGYSMLAKPADEQNTLGSWQNNQWIWAAGAAGLTAILWQRYHKPSVGDYNAAAASTAKRRSYLGGSPAVFGNNGSFSQNRYANNLYYKNNRYKNSRYISSGRSWLGYVASTSYRSGSSSGSRSSSGK